MSAETAGWAALLGSGNLGRVTMFCLGVWLHAVAWTAVALLIANLPRHREPLAIRAGAVLIVTGLLGFTLLTATGPLWLIASCALLQGAGFGFAWAPMVRRIVAGVPVDVRAATSAAVPTTQLIGYAIGAAVSGLAANVAGLDQGLTTATASAAAFWVFAVFLPLGAAGLALAWRLAALPEPQAPACEVGSGALLAVDHRRAS